MKTTSSGNHHLLTRVLEKVGELVLGQRRAIFDHDARERPLAPPRMSARR